LKNNNRHPTDLNVGGALRRFDLLPIAVHQPLQPWLTKQTPSHLF